jgi:acyl-CoA thioesterase I
MNLRLLLPPVLAVLLLAPVAMAAEEPVRIVALGDSLTAGFGLAPGQSFPEQLEQALRKRGHNVEVANAGVSGDTASAGLERLDWSVPEEADAVIVALGANDALRGIDPAVTRAALDEIVGRLAARGQAVLVAGMAAPRNLDDSYIAAFDALYPEVAEAHGALLYPFFLEGVAMEPALNLADGIHPNAAGIARMVEGILPHVEALTEQARTAEEGRF